MNILISRNVNQELILWSVEVLHFDKYSSVVTKSGKINYKLVENIQTVKEGKNIGKSNETSVKEQANFIAKSKYNLKLKKGYKEISEPYRIAIYNFISFDIKVALLTVKELDAKIPVIKTDENDFVKPMKAVQYYKSSKNYTDSSGKLWKDRKYYFLTNLYNEKVMKEVKNSDVSASFPCMIQPKINGVRAFLSFSNGKVKITSKEGLEYKNLNHITDEFEMNRDMLNVLDNIVYDGELYIKDFALQDIASAVKSYNMHTNLIKFHIFDLAIPNMSNMTRIVSLKAFFERVMISNSVLVSTFVIHNHQQVVYRTKKFIEKGYEGSIIRDFEADYVFGGRRNNMSKLKTTLSADFKIVNIIPQPKKPKLGLFVCEYKGKTFKVNPTFDEKTKEEILIIKNAFINKKLQCTFYEWTNDMKPFHIIDTVVRDYE